MVWGCFSGIKVPEIKNNNIQISVYGQPQQLNAVIVFKIKKKNNDYDNVQILTSLRTFGIW